MSKEEPQKLVTALVGVNDRDQYKTLAKWDWISYFNGETGSTQKNLEEPEEDSVSGGIEAGPVESPNFSSAVQQILVLTGAEGIEIDEAILLSIADSYLKGADRDRNEGATTRLRLQGSMGVGFNRAAVAFDPDMIERFLERYELNRAILILSIADNEDHWGDDGQPVDAHPLLVDFVEGNGWSPDTPGFGRGGGRPEEGTRGEGPGVTWNCAVDADVANNQRDCGETWRGGSYAPATAPPVMHFDTTAGEVEWDVTEDVLNGVTAWLIKKRELGRGGNVRYYSLEGALEEHNLDLAPTLILER